MSFKEIKRKYYKQISWITKQVRDLTNSYDIEEIRQEKGIDEYGTKYCTLLIQHNCAALLGRLFINLDNSAISTYIVKKILTAQYAGGWGPNKDRLTMWACQQNVEFLTYYLEYFKGLSREAKLFCRIYGLRLRTFMLTLGILGLISSIVWIIISPSRLEEAMLTVIMSILIALLSGSTMNKD